MDTNAYDRSKWMTIKECLEASGYHNAHFRMNILKKGLIDHIREDIPGTNIPRILVSRKSFEAFMAKGKKTQRADGRSKFTLYATPEEFEAVQAALAKAKLQTPVRRANVPHKKS